MCGQAWPCAWPAPARKNQLLEMVTTRGGSATAALFEPELVELLALIDEQSSLVLWPRWATAMLRVDKLADARELLVIGIFMYSNGVARPTIFAWAHARYSSATATSDGATAPRPLPPAWVQKLRSYLDRVEQRDPELWTWSLSTNGFRHLDGAAKIPSARHGFMSVISKYTAAVQR